MSLSKRPEKIIIYFIQFLKMELLSFIFSYMDSIHGENGKFLVIFCLV